MQRITTRQELVELAKKLGVRPDWHEPDEQGLTAEVHGVSFDNAGFWPAEDVQPDLRGSILEHHVVLQRYEYDDDDLPVVVEDIACVNLATLFAWATGLED